MGAVNLNQNRTFYKLKVEKETNVPLFYKQKKENDKWVVAETFNAITGFLKKIELGSYVYEGDTIDTLKFLFDDDVDKGDSFQVEASLNYLTRSILNSLAGSDTIGHVMIKVYTTKPKDGNGKAYPNAYVEINHQKASWKYTPDEVPRAKDVKFGGKTLKDDTEVNDFFKLLVPEINDKIISEFAVEAEMQGKPQPETTTHDSATPYGKGGGASKSSDWESTPDPIDDGLPF